MHDPPRDTLAYRSTLLVLSTTQLLSWAVLYYGFASLVLPMQREFGWSQPQMMGAFTLALSAWGAASFGAGALIDRERARAVMGAAPLVAAAGLLLWSAAQALWHLYAALLLCGLAMAGSLYEAAFGSVTRRFPGRYRQAVTTLTLVGGFASTLAFPSFAVLVPALGWRATLVVAAGVMLGVALANAWALRALPRESAVAAAAAGGAVPGAGVRFAEAVRSRAFWLLTACFALNSFIVAAFWAHAVAAFDAKGWSPAAAVGVLAWIGPAQVLGRASLAAVGRRLSMRSIGIAVLAGMPLAMLLFAVGARPVEMLVFAALYGSSAGMATIVRGTAVPETFGAREVARIGGALSAVSLAGRAAAPLLSAWALVLLGGYRELGLGLAVLGALALWAFVVATRRPPTGASRA